MSSGSTQPTFRLPPQRRSSKSALKLHAAPERLRDAGDPWCSAWMMLLRRTVSPEAFDRAAETIEAGAVIRFDAQQGRIRAVVLQGEPGGRVAVEIGVEVLADDQWHDLAAAISQDAGTVAALGADRLPEILAQQFSESGLPLWGRTFDVQCGCGQHGCVHAAAAGWIMADRILADPLEALGIRGFDPDEFTSTIRQSRAVRARGRLTAHPEPPVTQEQVQPLESCPEDFWQCDPCIHELEQLPAPAHAPLALLRRLGPPPFGGRFPMLGLLASVYDTASRAAQRRREMTVDLDEEEQDQS